MSVIKETWAQYKHILLALGIGLLVGPFISNAMGWQLPAAKAEDAVRQAVQEQQVSMCNYLSRQDMPDPSKLDFSARTKIAEAHATMPWESEVRSGVMYGCADKLAEKPNATAKATSG